MTIAFRSLEAHDLPELRSWFEDAELSRRMSFPSDEWFDYVTDGSVARCWIADMDSRPIAEIQVDQDGEEPGYLDIAVRPDLRGQGIGRAVLTAFLAGPGSAYPVLEGRIEPDNTASLKCCRRCGFELSEELDEDGFVRAVYDQTTRNETG